MLQCPKNHNSDQYIFKRVVRALQYGKEGEEGEIEPGTLHGDIEILESETEWALYCYKCGKTYELRTNDEDQLEVAA